MKKIITGLFIYISTGILQPIIIDTLRHHNCLGHKYLLLPTLANTLGMALCGLLVSKSEWQSFLSLLLKNARTLSSSSANNSHIIRMIILTSIVDLLSGMLLTFGILVTGGAIFVILYNSCPVWTAMLSRIILHNKLSCVSFIGVLSVCVGLVVNVFGSTKLQSKRNDLQNEGNSLYGGSIIVVGSIIVLIGSLLHSLMFVLSEMTLSGVNSNETNAANEENITTIADEKDATNETINFIPSSSAPSNSSTIKISGILWSCCLGTIEASFMLLWVFIGTLLYGFHANDTTIAESKPTASNILSGFFLLVLVDAAHAAAFFTLLQNIGAISSALIKGVQTVIVIIISAIFFCGVEETQCLTFNKICSTSFVIVGVFCYGVGSAGTKKNKHGTTEV